MKQIISAISLILAILLVACEKEPYPELPLGNDPIYSVKGLVNSDSLNFTVGLENVDIKSGTSTKNGLTTYYGEMSNAIKNEKIRIEFIQLEKQRTTDGYNVFESEQLSFLVQENAKLIFDFGGVGNQKNNFSLEDKNGNFVNTNTMNLDEFGRIQGRAMFTDYGSDVFDFSFLHGFENKELISDFTIQGAENIILVQALNEFEVNEWYINNMLVGTGSFYSGEIVDGIHQITHRIVDIVGNESSTSKIVRFKGGKDFWEMTANYAPEYTFENYNYGRVVVSMFKNGEWYSSEFTDDNKLENFNMNEIQIIQNQVSGKPFVAFNFNFSCTLENQDKSAELNLSDLTGKFLVGLH
jgi:hypothetical protein